MKIRPVDILLIAGLALCANVLRAATTPEFEQIRVGSGKTHMIDAPSNIDRVSIASPEVAEAVPVSARTVMINGKTTGETSLILWLADGSRRQYDVTVGMPEARLNTARDQLEAEFGDKVQIESDGQNIYLKGVVHDLYASQRAITLASAFGKVVNLLNVEAPAQETQILLKVRFADVDRNKSQALGINFAGLPSGFPFAVRTGANSAPSASGSLTGGGGSGSSTTINLNDALNLLFIDPHLNLESTLQDLAAKAALQILAEPNVLALNGHVASFVSGGEFPYPTLQGGGSGIGQITIQFRQFGVQIKFLPNVTPRGTIRLHVTPEVSSLDYANALTVSGFTIPALTSRKVETDVELEDGQSFAIAGLLDQRTTDSWSRIPGLADIPLIGKLFQAKSSMKSNSELLIIITPQIVAPSTKPIAGPEFPGKFLDGKGVLTKNPPQTPGPDQTGPPPTKPRRDQLSMQEMEKIQRDWQAQATAAPATGSTSYAPTMNNGDGLAGGSGAAQPLSTSPPATGPSAPAGQKTTP